MEYLVIADSLLSVKKFDFSLVQRSEPVVKKEFLSRLKLFDQNLITQTFLLQQQKTFEAVEGAVGQLSDLQMFMLVLKLVKNIKIQQNDSQGVVQIKPVTAQTGQQQLSGEKAAALLKEVGEVKGLLQNAKKMLSGFELEELMHQIGEKAAGAVKAEQAKLKNNEKQAIDLQIN